MSKIRDIHFNTMESGTKLKLEAALNVVINFVGPSIIWKSQTSFQDVDISKKEILITRSTLAIFTNQPYGDLTNSNSIRNCLPLST